MLVPESDDPADAYVGTWISEGGKYMEFRDDGTFSKAESQSALKSNPFETGTFTFDGEILRMTTSDSDYCTGFDAVYGAEPSEDCNFIAHTWIDDLCWVRANDFRLGITRVDG